MTLYRDIISKALVISWRHKFLWFLAFFAALAGNGGELELVFSGSDSVNGQSYVLGVLRAFYENGTLQQITANVREFFGAYPLPSVFLVVLLVLLFVLLVWIIIVAQAALVWALAQLRDAKPVHFPTAFGHGMKLFSPIFLLNLVTKAIVLGIIFLVALPLGLAYIRTGGETYNALYILTVYFALVPVSIVLSFIVKYASVYAVVHNQPWRTALKQGWLLFLNNWLVSVELAVILFVINAVVSLLLVFPLVIIGLTSSPVGAMLFFALLFMLGALLSTFQYGVWVLLFSSLEAGTVRAKLVRWADRVTGRGTTPPAPATK
ncbi:MAG: hypothetical protein HY340_03500 [Candidatus Kerfeldbacteria bacterium]|nr:hypothetical protein [Candidatus Kerfeldbacteria bacterium]